MKRCTTNLEDEVFARLNAMLSRERRSESSMIAILIEEALDARERKPATAERS